MIPQTRSPAPIPSSEIPTPPSSSVASIPAATWIPCTFRPPVSGTPSASPITSPCPPSYGRQMVAFTPRTRRRRESR